MMLVKLRGLRIQDLFYRRMVVLRIIKRWMKRILREKMIPLMLNGEFYKTVVRITMIYGSKF